MNPEQIPYFGETLALVTAVVWALAVILFKKSGETVHPVALNLFKNTLAVLLFLPTIYIFGGSLIRDVPNGEYLVLLASGALGIGIADTLFFKSLNTLGAGLTAIVDCLYSPFIIILSFLWLGESMSFWEIVGVFLILSAVLTAISKKGRGHLTRSQLMWGLFYGVMSMAVTAIGIVMVKPLLDRSPLLWVIEIRLIGGMLILLAGLLFHPRRANIIKSLHLGGGWKYTLLGSFLGAYLSMIIWLGGMKFTDASIAASLNQTNTIFIFIFAAWLLKEPINRQRSLGIALGMIGSVFVIFG